MQVRTVEHGLYGNIQKVPLGRKKFHACLNFCKKWRLKLKKLTTLTEDSMILIMPMIWE